MNKLSYGLLAFLATEDLTGYELMHKMKTIWNTTHSRIYPLLSELECLELVSYSTIKQNNKPDKKVYSITDKGKELIIKWIKAPTNKPVIKDEMLLKISCIQLLDKDDIITLIDEREKYYEERMKLDKKMIDEIKGKCLKEVMDVRCQYFGRYVLLEKDSDKCKMEIKWCKWLKNMYVKKNTAEG